MARGTGLPNDRTEFSIGRLVALQLAGLRGVNSSFWGDFRWVLLGFVCFVRNFALMFVFGRAGCLSYVKTELKPGTLAGFGWFRSVFLKWPLWCPLPIEEGRSLLIF